MPIKTKLIDFSIIIPSILHIIFSIVTHNAINTIIDNTSTNLGIDVSYINIFLMIMIALVLWNINKLDLIGYVSPDDKSSENIKKIKQIGTGLLVILYWVIMWPIFENMINNFSSKYKPNPTLFNIFVIGICIFILNKYDSINQIL